MPSKGRLSYRPPGSPRPPVPRVLRSLSHRQRLEVAQRRPRAGREQEAVLVGPAAVQDEDQRIDRAEGAVGPLAADLVVEMRGWRPSRCCPRWPAGPPASPACPWLHVDAVVVAEEGDEAAAVLDDHQVAVAATSRRCGPSAPGRRRRRRRRPWHGWGCRPAPRGRRRCGRSSSWVNGLRRWPKPSDQHELLAAEGATEGVVRTWSGCAPSKALTASSAPSSAWSRSSTRARRPLPLLRDRLGVDRARRRPAGSGRPIGVAAPAAGRRRERPSPGAGRAAGRVVELVQRARPAPAAAPPGAGALGGQPQVLLRLVRPLDHPRRHGGGERQRPRDRAAPPARGG